MVGPWLRLELCQSSFIFSGWETFSRHLPYCVSASNPQMIPGILVRDPNPRILEVEMPGMGFFKVLIRP